MNNYLFFAMTNNLGKTIWCIQDRKTGDYVFQSSDKLRAMEYYRGLEAA